jgi:ABC-2 type transport system permease protein
MTMVDTPAPIAVPRLATAEVSALKVTQLRVIKSEWLKFRTLRSSWLVLLAAIGSMIGVGIAMAWSTASDWTHMRPRQQARFNPLADPMSGFNLAQLAVGVLAILLTAGEYPGGMIRATLSAVPKRLPVLWAKLLVFTSLTALTMIPATIATFFISQRILIPTGKHVGWSMPMIPRVIIGTGLYLTIVAILAIGIGAIVRNLAGGIAAFVGILLVLPAITSGLSQTWSDRINKWVPSNAGQAIMRVQSDPSSLSPWRGLAMFGGYAVAAVIAAAILLKRRDA